MTDKIRVKDLADELHMTTKEILGVIKELSIQARASNSVLANEEIVRIKDRIRDKQVPEGGAEKKDTVIVRRRRSDPADKSSAHDHVGDSDHGSEELSEKAVEEVVAPKAKETAKASVPSGNARIVSRPGDSVTSTEKVPAPHKAAEAQDFDSVEVESDKVEPLGKSVPESVESHAQKIKVSPAQTDLKKVEPPVSESSSENAVAAPKADSAPAAPQTARIITPANQVKKEQAEAHSTRKSEAATETKGSDAARATSGVRVISTPDVKKDAAPQNTGGVRVISRPTAQQQQRPAQQDRRPGGGSSQPSGGRFDRSDRPQTARPGSGRPQAGEGRGDTRTDGRGDSRNNQGGAPRPGAPRGGQSRPMPTSDTFAPAPAPDGDSRNKKRQKGKRTVDFAGDSRDRFGKGSETDDIWTRNRRNKGRKGKVEKPTATQPVKAARRKIRMEEFIRVADLAHQMSLKAGEIIKVLFNLGVMATINQSLDVDTATLVAAEFDYEIEKVGFSEAALLSVDEDAGDPDKMVTRPPVVTIMGHVDHGKTSLLDAIRKTSVTEGEAGGITQHIGAYHVHTKKGDIVFLDTPGHEAFTAMRARGAEVTDIVVLVVAADDGVMEQTREAINHAKAAGVTIMVAVNKMDKEQANPDRVKRELADLGMVPEEWGGDVTFSYVSAKTRAGLDEFLELLAIQAEILELKANPDTQARGHIVEAKLDKGRGALGTVLIQQGTLHVGDTFVCGIHHGRVRAMFDDQGKRVTEAGPSIPVEVQGFMGVPEAGEEFICLADEKTARRIAEQRALKQRERELAKESKVTLETFLSLNPNAGESHTLNLVVKADVQGSLEAVIDQLKKLSTEKVKIDVVHGGTGAISESDVLLAAASNAIIIGFNVRPAPKAKDLAELESVDIRFYDIIYKLVEEIRSAMERLLKPVEKEVFVGSAEVRETFSVPKIGIIAGCLVSDGKITRNSQARLLRDGVVIFTGKISSLKRFKDDAKEVMKGYECGIGIENYNDIKIGDVVEAFEIVEEAATL